MHQPIVKVLLRRTSALDSIPQSCGDSTFQEEMSEAYYPGFCLWQRGIKASVWWHEPVIYHFDENERHDQTENQTPNLRRETCDEEQTTGGCIGSVHMRHDNQL